MKRIRVKICGITRVEDAIFCANTGADAIGLVFCEPSPRCISVTQAQEIINKTPPFVTTVALFMDDEPTFISEVINSVNIDLLQFHGEEDNSFCNQFGKPFIKALSVTASDDFAKISDHFPNSRGFIVDSNEPGQIGGTGKTFDWSKFPQNNEKPLILAGGLNPENIRQAIIATTPYGVDVSSGVESAKGIKDHHKIAEFIRGANDSK